ncbi:hypothetical protein ACGWY5_002134 [Enterococcus hirae]
MKGLKQLIFEKEKELQSLEDSLGLGFPIVEQAKMTQISHLRLELEDLRQIEKSIHLNDNQKIVLEWLKGIVEQYTASPICAISLLSRLRELRKFNDKEAITVDNAYCELDFKEQTEVLSAFAQWGLRQEEAE